VRAPAAAAVADDHIAQRAGHLVTDAAAQTTALVTFLGHGRGS
jgi:hypothetical protein